MPGDGVVYPPAAAGFYLAEARRLGAEVFLARALSASQGQVLLSDGVSLSAERIVLAVGTECDLLPSLPIQKRKGHLVITDRYPDFLHHQLVELGYLKSAHKVIGRLGRIQYPTAPDRTIAAGLFATVWQRGSRGAKQRY